MGFPYGNAPLGLLLLAIAATVGIVAISDAPHGEQKPDLIFATFTKEHAAAYRQALPAFERANNCTVQIQVVGERPLQSRLHSAMQVGADVPDMVELQDGWLSFFTRGMLEDVQFVDLTDRLKESGLYDRLVANRFSKWSSRGRIFALPHDVHPVMLAYRKDIVAQLGIDVNTLTTWDEFARVGREVVVKDRNGDGAADRYMLDMPTDGTAVMPLLAMQRGASTFDEHGNVTFDSEAHAEVMCWYVQQIQGPKRIAFPAGWGQNLAKSAIDGLVLFYFCPDWRTRQFQSDMPGLKGKMGLMPLPAWEPGGRRTSTWGATGLAFPKRGQNFELAWKLAMYLYFDAEQLGPRFAQTNILPPLVDSWDQPEFKAINPHWDMSLGQAFIRLAPQVPAAPTNAYHFMALSKLSKAFTKASQYYAERGEAGLREYTRGELKVCADEVRVIMRRNRFLNQDKSEPVAAGGAAR